jgi:hypothetical protein
MSFTWFQDGNRAGTARWYLHVSSLQMGKVLPVRRSSHTQSHKIENEKNQQETTDSRLSEPNRVNIHWKMASIDTSPRWLCSSTAHEGPSTWSSIRNGKRLCSTHGTAMRCKGDP